MIREQKGKKKVHLCSWLTSSQASKLWTDIQVWPIFGLPNLDPTRHTNTALKIDDASYRLLGFYAQSQSLSTSLEPLEKGTRRNRHIFKLFGKWLELGWDLREPPILPNTWDPGWAQPTITDWQEEVVGGWWWGFRWGGSLGMYLPIVLIVLSKEETNKWLTLQCYSCII
jgi:hypothetical protein